MARASVLLCAAATALPATGTSAAAFTPTAELPDLFTTVGGQKVVTTADWQLRRGELKNLVQEHILGTLPPSGGVALLSATALNSSNISGAISSCYIRLAFEANATNVELDIELAWPTATAKPLPLFFTQWNHRAWGLQGVQRGYMMVLYPGADTRDASGGFRAAFPAASFHKILARAFVASRVLDFILAGGKGPATVKNLPHRLPEVNPARVTITGHSRNGKQSIIAAAFDERFTAVVGSSPGTPVSAPVRFSSPDFNGETTSSVNSHRDWWLPSLKTYFGKEHTLPADGHMILALVAPRHLMLATARSDGEGDMSFADEQNIQANEPVWKLLGAPSALHIKWREGRHHGFDDPQTYFDWFDFAAAKPNTGHLFPTTDLLPLPHAFDWARWSTESAAARPPVPPQDAPLTERVDWMLGDSSAITTAGLVGGVAYCESGAVGSEWDYKAKLMMRDSFHGCRGEKCENHNLTRVSLSFGAYVTASLFLPCDDASCREITHPLPVIIFLHGTPFPSYPLL